MKIQEDISGSFRSQNGLMQRESLACLSFNMALETAVRRADIDVTGTILNKSVRLLTHMDDTAIIGSESVKFKML